MKRTAFLGVGSAAIGSTEIPAQKGRMCRAWTSESTSKFCCPCQYPGWSIISVLDWGRLDLDLCRRPSGSGRLS